MHEVTQPCSPCPTVSGHSDCGRGPVPLPLRGTGHGHRMETHRPCPAKGGHGHTPEGQAAVDEAKAHLRALKRGQ